MSDRIQRIKELQEKGYKVDKPLSLVLVNLYSLITIVTISVAILIYVNFIQPQQKEPTISEEELKREKYFQERAKQIALSHKLNNINQEKEQKDENNSTK